MSRQRGSLSKSSAATSWSSICSAPQSDVVTDGSSSATSVAVCLTGLLRSLLSLPVRASFESMVRRPLTASGHSVDPFIVLSEQRHENAELRARIDATYTPVSMRLVAERPSRPLCRHASAFGHDHFGASAGVLQHFSVSTCFGLVGEEERRRRASYGWVLRMRTDLVLFAPFRLPTRTDRVYVPGGGMSYRSWLRCSNDHLFLCPRQLCAPYATLIHNFNNSNCTPLPGYAAGGDGVLEDGTIRPQPIWHAFAWHIPRAYNASNSASRRPDGPCGLVVELGLLYAIARTLDGDVGAISCVNNLHTMWASLPRRVVPSADRQCAMEECTRLSRQFSGGRLLNTSEISTYERKVFELEGRAGMHRAANSEATGSRRGIRAPSNGSQA